LADLFQQFDLDLLNLKEPIVLLSQEVIDFFVQVPDLEFGLEIDLVIILSAQSIARLGPVLAHHDYGCLQRSQTGENEIEENERVRIEGAVEQKHCVKHDPDDDNAPESDDEFPTPAELRDFIRQMFAKGELALELLLNVLGKHFVLPQTLDDFMVECGELADLTLEGILDIIASEDAEIAEANELLRIPVRPLRFDELSERRANIFTDRAVLWRKSPATNLAGEFSRRGCFHCYQLRRSNEVCRLHLEPGTRDSKLVAMEETEVPLEHLHEEIHHHAEHSGEKWISWVALSTAILAVLAAIAGLLSGSHANEAMMRQIESADQWAFYQAKGIKAAVLDAKMSLSGSSSEADREKAEKYSEEQNEIQKEAREKETEAKTNFHQHEVFARGVTLFQIAIAIAAISALTKRRRYWMVSMFMGAVGCIFLALGFVQH
jgi:hypothetical protein